MRIFFYVYPSAFQNPGGGEIQLLKTREYLQKRGIETHLYNPWQDKLSKGDILHVFGSVKYCHGLIRTAKEAGARVVLSTICWYDWRSAVYTYPKIKQRTLNILRFLAKWTFPGFPSMRREMIIFSDLLMPNSEAEAGQLVRFFGADRNKIKVIPNGVDLAYEKADPKIFSRRFDIQDFLLCVGRIEPRKNQLALIRAHRGMDRPLVVIGEAVSRYQDYEAECRRAAAKNVQFIGPLPNDSELLRSAYAACHIFALPSWFETPGLAALEAGLAGARLVITDGGSTKEYFAQEADYCDPSSISDIRSQLIRSLQRGKNGRLQGRIRENYSWEKVAEEVERGYQRLI